MLCSPRGMSPSLSSLSSRAGQEGIAPASLVLQQLLQPQLCWHLRSKALQSRKRRSAEGWQRDILCWEKPPSPHFQGSILLQAEAVWRKPRCGCPGQRVRDRGLLSSGWRHACRALQLSLWTSCALLVPAASPSMPRWVFNYKSKWTVGFFQSLPVFGTALFRRMSRAAVCRAKVGWRFSLYTSCVCSAKHCWKWLGRCTEGSGGHEGGV